MADPYQLARQNLLQERVTGLKQRLAALDQPQGPTDTPVIPGQPMQPGQIPSQVPGQPPAQSPDPMAMPVQPLIQVAAEIQQASKDMRDTVQMFAMDLSQSLEGINQKFSEKVMPPNVTATVDTIPGIDALAGEVQKLGTKIASLNQPDPPPISLDPVVKGLKAVQTSIESIRFPVAKSGGNAFRGGPTAYLGSDGSMINVTAALPLPVTGSISAGTQYADGTARGTATGTLLMVDDGTNIQSVSGDTSGRLNVNAVGNVASGATDSGNPVKVGGIYNSSAITLTNGQRGDAQLDASGYLKVNVAAGSAANAAASATGSAVPASADYTGVNVAGTLRGQTAANPSGTIYAAQTDIASVAGTTLDTNSGVKSAGTPRFVIATDQPVLTNALKVVSEGSATAVGASISKTAALSTTVTAVKASSGRLYGYHIYNPNTVVAFVQIFNVATGSVTLNSTVPDMNLVIPAGGVLDAPGIPVPLPFSTAISVAATTTATGSTALDTGLLAQFFYI